MGYAKVSVKSHAKMSGMSEMDGATFISQASYFHKSYGAATRGEASSDELDQSPTLLWFLDTESSSVIIHQ